jgi:hypothetical protein
MTASEATSYVELHAQSAKHPVLSAGEVAACLTPYAEEDGTWTRDGVMSATADAWDVKTSKAADHHDVSVNGRMLSAQQVKANCEERARWYRRRIGVEVA